VPPTVKSNSILTKPSAARKSLPSPPAKVRNSERVAGEPSAFFSWKAILLAVTVSPMGSVTSASSKMSAVKLCVWVASSAPVPSRTRTSLEDSTRSPA
jgi:hypothetical protein